VDGKPPKRALGKTFIKIGNRTVAEGDLRDKGKRGDLIGGGEVDTGMSGDRSESTLEGIQKGNKKRRRGGDVVKKIDWGKPNRYHTNGRGMNLNWGGQGHKRGLRRSE